MVTYLLPDDVRDVASPFPLVHVRFVFSSSSLYCQEEEDRWDTVLGEMWSAPRRVLRPRVVLRARTQSVPSHACRKKRTKGETKACSKRLSVQGHGKGRVLTGRRETPDREAMRQELEQLKYAHVSELKEAERAKQRVAREERMKRRRALQQKRQMFRLEQAEKRMSLKVAREKLTKAKLLLRDAKKSQRAAEKERRKRELAELVARKKEERRRVRQLSGTLTIGQGSRDA